MVQVWVRAYVCLRGRKKDALEMFSPGQHGVTLGIQSKLSPPSFSLPYLLSSKFLLFDRLLAYLPTYLPTYLLTYPPTCSSFPSSSSSFVFSSSPPPPLLLLLFLLRFVFASRDLLFPPMPSKKPIYTVSCSCNPSPSLPPTFIPLYREGSGKTRRPVSFSNCRDSSCKENEENVSSDVNRSVEKRMTIVSRVFTGK